MLASPLAGLSGFLRRRLPFGALLLVVALASLALQAGLGPSSSAPQKLPAGVVVETRNRMWAAYHHLVYGRVARRAWSEALGRSANADIVERLRVEGLSEFTQAAAAIATVDSVHEAWGGGVVPCNGLLFPSTDLRNEVQESLRDLTSADPKATASRSD